MKFFLLATALLACGVAYSEPSPPNILFIFADDLAYEGVGAFGVLDIDTPHLDSMVAGGTSFTHAYNMGAYGGAVCVASRAMLNTGRYVWSTYAHDTTPGVRADVENRRMWSQLMSDAGYRTYMTGKWHVKTNPVNVFDVVQNPRGGMPRDFWRQGSKDGSKPRGYGYFRPKDQADYETGWKPWDRSNGGFWEGGTHWSEVVADDAIAFMAEAKNREEPFFMYVAFNASHDPRQAPKEYIDRYPLDRVDVPNNFIPEYDLKDQIGCGAYLRDEALAPFPRTEFAVKVHRQEYFALITHMDDQIGRVLDALKENGLSDNTYVVFTADHGLAVGRHGLVGKQNMYDHSVRVPFMVVGPGIEKGARNPAPIYLQDIMPTTLDWASATIPADVEFKSLLPALNGEKHYEAIYGAYKNQQRMIQMDGWKYIAYPTCDGERLFNMDADPFEMNDLSANPEYAAKLKSMRANLLALSADLNDPLDYDDPEGSWKQAAPKGASKNKAAH